MSYAEEVTRHARIAILRFLADAPSYTSNVSMMVELLARVGISFTRAQTAEQVRWLSEQGFVTTEDHAGFTVVTATVAGVEIAQGIATHPEIKRPRPGS